MDDKITLIGKATISLEDPTIKIDSSVFSKKGQLGYVDKSFMTESEEGFRLAKIRIREERIPAIGDKFCSRCGQKGTVGQIIPEEDMPFMADGTKPDLIVNPHAFPSRMTIGQLVEVLTGKACLEYGAYGDCTAFVNRGPKNETFGHLLTNSGYNKDGLEILYDGKSGNQIQADIYIGPTYYMRLKHMVKDKINYRAQGPRTTLTRQTVQGRANDGGLRVGEMERDCIIAHGAATFLQESMLVRGDELYLAVCNKSGTIAIYNENQNIFLSPMLDGPIKFNGTLDGKLNIENVSKYGQDFSIVRVPYAFKLLMQELLAMNVQLRIITEENVDQLTSLSYSEDIKSIFLDTTIPNVIKADDITTEKPSWMDESKEVWHDEEQKPVTIDQSKRVSIYPSQVNYTSGDIVGYSQDTVTGREWVVQEQIGDDFILVTDDVDNLPSFAVLLDEGRKATITVSKMLIYKDLGVYNPNTPEYANKGDSFQFKQDSPGYVQTSPGSEFLPEVEGYNPITPEYDKGDSVFSFKSQSSESPDYRPQQSNESDEQYQERIRKYEERIRKQKPVYFQPSVLKQTSESPDYRPQQSNETDEQYQERIRKEKPIYFQPSVLKQTSKSPDYRPQQSNETEG